jgi:tetratricopeptide (TPR) repeat protein
LKAASLLLSASLALPFQQVELERGLDHFYNLEFDRAISIFTGLTSQFPREARFQNNLAQAVLFRAMLKAGALESELVTGGNSFLRREKMSPTPEEQRLFDGAVNAAMKLAQARLDKDPDDRLGLYDMGVAYGLRANYNFLVRKAWMDSLRDATTGRKLHSRLSELEPAMVDAELMQGAHDYVVGSLPWYYKFLGFLAGIRGDKDKGIATLQRVAQKGERNRADAAILLATIYRRERRAADAVPLLKDLIRQFPRNYLLRLELAQMYSDLGEKETALEAIAEVERMKFADLPAAKIHYFRGNLLFWYDDFELAAESLRKATAEADKLDPNTGVLSWMRLGQTYDMLGRRAEAQAAYRTAMAYAPESEAARESERYLRSAYRRKNK